jgi:hypothetical protein
VHLLGDDHPVRLVPLRDSQACSALVGADRHGVQGPLNKERPRRPCVLRLKNHV